MNDDPLHTGILPIKEDGFVHLGAPRGSERFVEEKVRERIDKIEILLSKLHLLENAHAEFVLLRLCFSLPKVSYLLRTCPPSPDCQVLWSRLDSLVRDSMNRVLGCSLSHGAWAQAELSVAHGGLGLRSSNKHCSSAYLASVTSSKSLLEQIAPDLNLQPNVEAALQHMNEVLEPEEPLTEAAVSFLRQKDLSIMIDRKMLEDVMANCNTVREKARMNSLGLPQAGAWLNVVPSPSLGLQLCQQEF